MSGSLNPQAVEWLKNFTGVDLNAYASAAASAAAPAPTKTVSTPFGDFEYLDKPGSKVEALMTHVTQKFMEAEAADTELDGASEDLQALDDKYQGLKTEDIVREVSKNTGHDLKNEAGSARGAGISNEGFNLLFKKFTQELTAGKGALALSQDEVKQGELEDKAADLAQQAKDWEDTIDKVLDAVEDVAKIAIDVKDPGAWMDLGKDVLKDIVSAANPLAKQAEEVAKEAKALKSDILNRKVAAAKKLLEDLNSDIAEGEKLVQEATHDYQVKRKTADDDYDKQAKGDVRIQDLKDGMELADKVYSLAYKTAGNAHAARDVLSELIRQEGKPETWMAKPVDGQKTINDIVEGLRAMYAPAEPKVNWSKKLAKQFQEFYRASGEAMADGADQNA